MGYFHVICNNVPYIRLFLAEMDELWHSISVYFLPVSRVIDLQCLYQGSHYSLQPGLLVVRYDFMWSFHEYIICQVLVITVYMDVLNIVNRLMTSRTKQMNFSESEITSSTSWLAKLGSQLKRLVCSIRKPNLAFELITVTNWVYIINCSCHLGAPNKLELFQVHFFYLGHCPIVHLVSKCYIYIYIFVCIILYCFLYIADQQRLE